MIHHSNINKLSNGRILVADDDVTGQMVVTALLEKAGYEAVVVDDGQQALEALEASEFDLVLMDCMMPVMDGFEATRAIRKADSAVINRHIPIIAITALSLSSDQQRCLNAGMDEYVSKPIDATMLIFTIKRCLDKARGEKAVLQKQKIPAQVSVDEEFLDRVIDNFTREIPQVVVSLQRALGNKDIGSLEGIGHRLKGSAGVLGASTIAARAIALEEAGRAGDLALAAILIPGLIEELQHMSSKLSDT